MHGARWNKHYYTTMLTNRYIDSRVYDFDLPSLPLLYCHAADPVPSSGFCRNISLHVVVLCYSASVDREQIEGRHTLMRHSKEAS